MKTFQLPGKDPPVRPGFSPAEKRRLLFMAFGLLLVLGAIYVSMIKANEYRERAQEEIPATETPMEETVLLPEIDPARIDALVKDGERVDRVVLEGEALDYLLDKARTLTWRHFEAMHEEELDAAKVAALEADPSAHRGDAFLARGWIAEIRTRNRGPTNREEHVGRLVLEDDSSVYFVVLDVDGLDADDFVRLDGLFMKVFTEEDASRSGEWIDGPLLVGPAVIRSYPALGPVTHLEPAYMAEVEDANLNPEEGEPRIVNDSPFDALWDMMAYARDLPEGEIDWDAAPLLDNTHLMAVVEHPEEWRAQPFRIPISRIQDARVLRAGENPARIEHYTQGWIGNTTWQNVVHFKYPVADYDIHLRDYARGRGFFLNVFSYQSADKGLRIAPVFVLQDLERIQPKPDPLLIDLGYAAVGIAAFLVVLFTVLLARDKRRSEALQEEMTRRRRARRTRQGPVGTTAP